MIKIKMVPVLSRIVSNLDLEPIIEKVVGLDLFDIKGKKITAKEITPEKIGAILEAALPEITKQVGAIGEFIPELVATYKGVSIEEAEEMDFAEIICDFRHDSGIKNFFVNALRKKVEHEL